MGPKGVPFGYLEFSHAIRGNPCPHARTLPQAAAGRQAAEPEQEQARVPYLVRFFLNRVSRVWGIADHTRSAIRIRTESAQRLTENRCEKLGSFCLK